MSKVNLIVKDSKGILTGLSLETHTSFSKYATSLTREKTVEAVSKRIETYSKYYSKKLETFAEMPTDGYLFLFDVKANLWQSLSNGKLVKVADVIKHKQALTDAITSKREIVTKFVGETYNVTGEKLKAVITALENSLTRNS